MTIAKKITIISLLASVFLSGCAQMPQQLDLSSVSNKLLDVGKGKFGETKFEQAGLANVLKSSDDPNGWPRIALTIEDMPSDAASTGLGWTPPIGYCMTFSATVWKSEKESRQVSHIPFCRSDINRDNNDWADMHAWAIIAHNQTKNTGRTRTNGPTPPLTAFPSTHSVIINGAGTKGAVMFSALLLGLGLDLSVDAVHDTRVWVVSTAR